MARIFFFFTQISKYKIREEAQAGQKRIWQSFTEQWISDRNYLVINISIHILLIKHLSI